ncbi:MAG: hypothetical protein KAI57_01955 [Candidatus Pacebacteria bacterium]|nr:hypothetical protein [Candidatus Paceibacterota bacterium]
MLFLGIDNKGVENLIQTPGYEGSITRVDEIYPKFAILCHLTCEGCCHYQDFECCNKENIVNQNLFLIQVASRNLFKKEN